MSIAVDQTRLRRIVRALLPRASLGRTEAMSVVQFIQLAAGLEHEDAPAEHAMMQTIAQQVGSLAGLEPGDLLPIPYVDDERTRSHWLGSLAALLTTPGARELTYVLAFIVTVADLELTALERAALDEFQRALALDDRRATDLVVFVTDVVGVEEELPVRPGAS